MVAVCTPVTVERRTGQHGEAMSGSAGKVVFAVHAGVRLRDEPSAVQRCGLAQQRDAVAGTNGRVVQRRCCTQLGNRWQLPGALAHGA
jgi:hypothetical protein